MEKPVNRAQTKEARQAGGHVMSASHTATLPWKVGPESIVENATRTITMAEARDPATAAFIVRCVNSHDDLAAALRGLVYAIDKAEEISGKPAVKFQAYSLARSALAKADA